MNPSESRLRNGWETYPAEAWNQRRPQELQNDVPFWISCAENYGSPVLDACCGNGRVSFPLAKKGFEVVGIDVNPGFIEEAEKRKRSLPDAGLAKRVEFRVRDIVDLDYANAFRLAIMPDWSFQVLLTQVDQRRFLAGLHRALMPGGAFAFNLFRPFERQRGLVDVGGRYEWPRDPSYHRGAPRTYDPETQVEELREHDQHLVRLRHTMLAELHLLFEMTGFAVSERYGDVDRRPFTGNHDDDYTLVVVKA